MFWNVNRGSVPNRHLGSRWQRVPIWRGGSSPEIQASGDPESGSKMPCPEFQLLRREISKNHSEALSRGDGALGASSEALDAPLPHPMGLATKHSWDQDGNPGSGSLNPTGRGGLLKLFTYCLSTGSGTCIAG